jgi:hypothetical protein
MFCHRYPTRVISSGDNVASSYKDGSSIVRSGCDCQHQSGRELGSSGMVNTCESLINAVTGEQAKDADACHQTDNGLDQKVRGQVQVLLTHLTQTTGHRRRGET